MSIIEEICKHYMLKGVGKPEYYLGRNFHTTKDIEGMKEVNNDDMNHHLSSKWLKEGVKTAFSARTYIEQSLNKLETMMGVKAFALQNSPISEAAHPELDDSPMLNSEDHSKFRSLIGCANWLVTLGRFDIAYAVNAFSRFSMAPQQRHLDGMIRFFGYLKKWPKGTIIIDPKYPDHSQFNVADYDQWKEFYLMQKKCYQEKMRGQNLWDPRSESLFIRMLIILMIWSLEGLLQGFSCSLTTRQSIGYPKGKRQWRHQPMDQS